MFEPREREDRNLCMMRWTARIFGAASLMILLSFLLGESRSWAKMSVGDVIGELFFSIGLMAGLILSWRTEFTGGAITLGSVLTFYFIYGLLLDESLSRNWWFIFFAIPGALFLTYGIAMSDGHAKAENGLKI